jgi:cation:H+ antiporter
MICAVGLAVRVWIVGRFAGGVVTAARHVALSPLLIGILAAGLGTLTPEATLSVPFSHHGNTHLALRNGYGFDIARNGLSLVARRTLLPEIPSW